MRPQISPHRRPVWRAIRQKRYALVPNTAFRSCLDCSTVRAAFSFAAMPPERRRSGTGDFAIRFPMATGFPLTAAVSTLNGLTPCGQSVKDTIPASNSQVRNGCGCAMETARRTSIRWPTSPLWLLRWPPFCTALTPTVHPNHSSEALKVPSHMAFSLGFLSGLLFMRFFSLPGDPRLLSLFALLF